MNSCLSHKRKTIGRYIEFKFISIVSIIRDIWLATWQLSNIPIIRFNVQLFIALKICSPVTGSTTESPVLPKTIPTSKNAFYKSVEIPFLFFVSCISRLNCPIGDSFYWKLQPQETHIYNYN